MKVETKDIFFAAYLMSDCRLISANKTSGHKNEFIFESQYLDISELKVNYINSEFYNVKSEIDKLKTIGDHYGKKENS